MNYCGSVLYRCALIMAFVVNSSLYSAESISIETNAETVVNQLFQQINEGFILSLAFNTEGTQAIVADMEGKSALWDMQLGKKCLDLTPHEQGVKVAAFGVQGTKIITGSVDGMIHISDAKTGKQEAGFSVNKAPSCFACNTAGSELLVGLDDGTLCVYECDQENCCLKETIGGHTGKIQSITLTTDGSKMLVMTATADGNKMLGMNSYNASAYKKQSTGWAIAKNFSISTKVKNVEFSDNEAFIIVHFADGNAAVFESNLSTEALLQGTKNDVGTISAIACHKDILFVGYGNGILDIWKVNQKAFGEIKVSDQGIIGYIVDCCRGNNNNTEPKKEQPLTLLARNQDDKERLFFNRITKLVCSPDGSHFLVCADVQAYLCVFDHQTGKIAKKMEESLTDKLGTINSLQFSSDGKKMLVSKNSHAIRNCTYVWDVETGEKVACLEDNKDQALAQFSPKGDYLHVDDGQGVSLYMSSENEQAFNEYQKRQQGLDEKSQEDLEDGAPRECIIQ